MDSGEICTCLLRLGLRLVSQRAPVLSKKAHFNLCSWLIRYSSFGNGLRHGALGKWHPAKDRLPFLTHTFFVLFFKNHTWQTVLARGSYLTFPYTMAGASYVVAQDCFEAWLGDRPISYALAAFAPALILGVHSKPVENFFMKMSRRAFR